MKVVNENRRLLFVLKEKISGTLVVAPEGLVLVEESLQETPTPVDSRPYKVYTALLTQSGTDAPVATVLENTLGVDIEWSRFSEGYYKATPSEPIFEENKTFHFVNSTNQGYQFEITSQFEKNEWRITVIDAGITVDSVLKYLPIEVRVYN